MSGTGTRSSVIFSARNVYGGALSASKWPDILYACLSVCPFPETHIRGEELHQLTAVLSPAICTELSHVLYLSWSRFHRHQILENVRAAYKQTLLLVLFYLFFPLWVAVFLWTINKGHAVSTPCYTRNVQTSKWWVINWRGHNSFVNWQGWKKRNKKTEVMGGKGIRNERTRVKTVFQLVTALRRHQRSFSTAINNMALSVFFVALSPSLSFFSTYGYISRLAHRIYGLFQAVSFEPRTWRCGGGTAGNYIFLSTVK